MSRSSASSCRLHALSTMGMASFENGCKSCLFNSLFDLPLCTLTEPFEPCLPRLTSR